VLTSGITKFGWTPSRLRPVQAWCRVPGSSFLVTRNLGSSCSVAGCEETGLLSSSNRVRSFSLDHLRLATTQSVVDDSPDLRVEVLPDSDEEVELRSDPDVKAKGLPVAVPIW
jgi:hypothetical protein